MNRDQYSNFGFYNALAADVYTAAAEGTCLDLKDFDAATITVNAVSLDSTGANSIADIWWLVLQHGLASAAGVSAYSNVPLSQIIHSVEGGYASTAEDGKWQYLVGSGTSAGYAVSTAVYTVGYKKDTKHRYLRLYVSISGNPSGVWMAAVAMLGRTTAWPVNTPVENG